MRIRRQYSALLILILISGCNSGSGVDSLFGRTQRVRLPVSDCIKCHNSTNSPTLDPLVANGTGTSGKHLRHFQERGIACERCHYNYLNAPTHMNGAYDKGNSSLVNLNITGPIGTWNPATGSCSGVACHGAATVLWYNTNTWTTPAACASCHGSGFSTALDPAVTNGGPPAGRHGKHVTERAIGCERCHYQYPGMTSHANGVLDTADPLVSVIQFNIVGTAGLWTNDTGSQTGQCAGVSCHGADTLSWYGSGTWMMPSLCTTCHSSAYLRQLDPVVTNGSGNSGKHVKHVTDIGMVCTKCHLDYPLNNSHASGIMDTQNRTVLIVSFDSTNQTGTWVNDTGSETGNCSSLTCHWSDTAWYGSGGLSPLPPCASCHSSAIKQRRQVMGQNGDFGANSGITSHHVTVALGNDPSSDQCKVCHEMSKHMGGTVRLLNADTAAAVVYESSSPSSLEPFCLSCHDANGASNSAVTVISGGTYSNPFNDGSLLGAPPGMYQAGNKIADYWIDSGFNNIHRSKGATCAGAELNNGTGLKWTGCHGSNGSINMHGSSAKGLLTANLTLPIPAVPPYGFNYTYNDFKLCFDCHENFPSVTKEVVLGYKSGGHYDVPVWAPTPYYTQAIQSLFRDRYVAAPPYPSYWEGTVPLYNDSLWGDPYLPLHNYHLFSPEVSVSDSQLLMSWKYRGDSSKVGRVTCTTCHNVHGTNGTVSTYEEFGIVGNQPYSCLGSDQYKSTNSLVDSLMKYYPVNCNKNCHQIDELKTYWHSPADE